MLAATGLTAQSGTALIIGISNYKASTITDLRFAHRDAEAFANYLQTTDVQTKLLTNEQATRAAIESALAWQAAKTKEGELAILYFAGHGDTEVVADDSTINGYLLAHDTPPNNYPLTAIGLNTLNDHLKRVTGRGGTALVISDACHAGSLAGREINGSGLTATEFLRKNDNQLRILSCLPDEMAQEGEQWGGGRGVFSYFFVDALKGLADEDQNKSVDIFEVESFVRSSVRKATQRQQLPTLSGDQRADIQFRTETDATGAIRQSRTRDIQAEFLAGLIALASPESQKNFARFERATERGDLLLPKDRSALSYYRALRQDASLAALGSLLSEKLVVSLLDSTQQALVDYLDTDRDELYLRTRSDNKYGRFVDYLATAAELVGKEDPRYPGIRARQFYFEAVQLRTAGDRLNQVAKEQFTVALGKAEQALALNPGLAYAWNEIGLLQLRLGLLPEATQSFREAIQRAPTWALPYSNLGAALRRTDPGKYYLEARRAYEEAIRLKPDYSLAYNNLGNLLAANSEPEDTVVAYLDRALAIDPRYADARYSLATYYSNRPGRTDDALQLLARLIAEDGDVAKYHFLRGFVYLFRKEYDSAATPLQTAVRQRPNWEAPYLNLINLYSQPEADVAAGKAFYADIIRENPTIPLPYVALALADTNDATWLSLAANNGLSAEEKLPLLSEIGYWLADYSLPSLTLLAFDKATELGPSDASTWADATTLHNYLGDEERAHDSAVNMLRFATRDQLADYKMAFEPGGEFANLASDPTIMGLLKEKEDD